MKGNSVSIKGNLTRNAEIRGISGDRSCVTFGLAWNNNHLRADNTPIDQPHYFEVSCWMSAGQQNYFLPLLTKGTTCSIIDGYLSYGTWVTKDGEKRSRVEIAVTDPFSSMTLLAPRKHRSEHEVIAVETADSGAGIGATGTNDVQTSLADDDGDESAAYSQAPAALESFTTEAACNTDLPFDTGEPSPEDIFEDTTAEPPTDDVQESNSEPASNNKTGKAAKPEATSSKKRAIA